MDAEKKKIFTLSLDSENRHMASAILFEGNRLAITHCVPVAGPPSQWREKMLVDIETKAAAGFAIAVEDRSGAFSPHATSVCFDDVEDGRTLLQQSFDWWFSLKNSGNLLLDTSVTRYDMKAGEEGSLIDIRHDEKGRIVYHPNWMQFHGGHKAMLLCVAAAMLEEPLSARWIDAMLAGVSKQHPTPPSPFASWQAITMQRDADRAKELRGSHE